ncbi:MAG TPA: DUF4013 domain-containing protein [Syntrophomonadaceae bacterium]|nr:DUF4013 domain-containing protein [Syntrophomonadaceae bacterium]
MDWYYYIRFPFNDREWFKKLGIGCIIFLVPIVNILALGYFVQCIKLGASGHRILPFWDDWEGLLRDGIMTIIILLAYMVIPLILTPLFLPIPFIGLFMQSVILLIVGLMIPLAIANYVISDEWQEAFNLGKILAQLSEVINDYVLAYLMIVLLTTISIALIFSMPLLVLIGAIINFYCGVVFANSVGQLLASAVCK